MNTELFISRRLFFDKDSKKFLSHRIIRIALLGIALGLAVMIVSVAVVTGFKKEIRNKVIGFGAHIQVINFDSNNSYETQPISKNQPFYGSLNAIDDIESVQIYATKPGMIKTEEYFQGIILKGVSSGYNWDFFRSSLIQGRLPAINDSIRVNEIIISENVSKLLHLKIGEKTTLFFLNEKESTPRILQLEVCGIYRTSLQEFDDVFILGDLKQIQRLNNWKEDEISGFEIVVSDFNKIDEIEQKVRNTVINYSEENSAILRTESITRQYPQMFDWLNVTDMNVWVIIILLLIVAGFNMISGLLVLILERSSMIGVLKAMGCPNWSIRKVFLYLSFFLTSRGMLWGNVVGISIIIIQKVFHIVKLNPETYYVDFVPLNFSITGIIALNVGTIAVIFLMLLIPSILVSKISPVKTIQFD